MATPLYNGLLILHESMSQQQGKSLHAAVEIREYFDKTLSVAELDVDFDDAFQSDRSLLSSLQKSLVHREAHRNANIKILELIQNLIEKYKPQISKYAKVILEAMVLFYLSSSVSAKEKENALSILQFLVQNDLCTDDDMTKLVFHLLKIKNEKKPAARVLQLTYELLGLISRKYPHCLLNDYETQIRDLFLQTLEPALPNQQKYSLLSIRGALNGFTYFLENFAPSPTTHPIICQPIYSCVKKMSDPGNIKDKTALRAAFHLLEKHAAIFSEQLYSDHRYWHNTLLQWLKLPGWIDRKSAIATLSSFHKELAHQLENRHSEADISILEADMSILESYINFFEATLESTDSRPYEVRIAINGFGVFSKLCKNLLPTRLGELLQVVMLRTEYMSIDNSNNKDILEHYPAIVQALSEIIEHTKELSAIQVSSLQNMIIELMKNFYLLSRAHHEMVVTSLMKTFENLSKLGSILDDVLEKVTIQGVIWACSHEIKLTANANWDTQKDWKEHITYENFIRLWLGLLDYSENQYEIKERVYTHFVNTLFVIIDKLDLSTRKRVFRDSNGQDQELYFCNPNLDFVPVKPKDFQIFFNIVDFYCDTLKQQSDKSHINFFTRFFNQWMQKMIAKAVEYPLLSGFLKFLELALRISDKLIVYELTSYIEHQTMKSLRCLIDAIIPKCPQMSGELQISCLRLIFSLPVRLLSEHSDVIVPVFRIGFNIGTSVHFMAGIALTALERLTSWLKKDDFKELSRLLEAVLPCLSTYLQKIDLQGETKIDVKIVEFRQNKIAKKVLNVSDADSGLLKLQKRILLYLGTLEPCHSIQMIENDQEETVLTRTTSEQNVGVKLSYLHLTPEIFLDTLIPRICYLATSSSNRKTKIAACELTNAIILYLIGTGHYQGDLWQKLCADILVLGSDGDDAVKQMFKPLLMQIIHFMTQPSQISQPGVEIFCDQLMEGISHQSSSAIRDLSARCLREFVTWNIKESTNYLTTTIGALLIRLILKKLKLYSFDSDHNKRCGATLAFNNLYSIIREDKKLISEHWLDFLHTFAINFIMCEENDGDTESSYDQISTCMDNIERVFFEHKDIFNRPDENRIIPNDFDGSSLKDAMLWLFKQCGAKQQYYRRKCHQIFAKLTPCVDGYNSTIEFLKETQSLEKILEVLEGKNSGVGIAGRSTLSDINVDSGFSIGLYTWLQQLLRSLDCHMWIMGDRLYNDDQFYEKSRIVNAIAIFLNHICLLELSPIRKIASIIREIISRILDYLVKVVPSSRLPESFWNAIDDSMNELILRLIFVPNKFGFHLKDDVLVTKIQSRLTNVINIIKSKAPQKMSNDLIDSLEKHFKNGYAYLVKNATQQLHLNTITHKERCTVDGLKFIVKSMKSFGFSRITLKFFEDSMIQMVFDLCKGIFEERQKVLYARNIFPDIKDYANNIMKIITTYDRDATDLMIEILVNQKEVHQPGTLGTISFGTHFMDVFRPSIYEHFLDNPETRIIHFVDIVNPDNIRHISRMLIQLTEYMYKWRRYDYNKLESVVQDLLDVWTQIVVISKTTAYDQSLFLDIVDLMIHIALICPYPLHEISTKVDVLETWILELLNDRDKSLELKTRVLSLVPCIIGQSHAEHPSLLLALKSIVGTLELAVGVIALDSILKAMVASQSVVLLKFIVRLTAADAKHILEHTIQHHLELFLKKQSAAQQRSCLDIPFQLFCDTSLEPNIRLSIMKRFLLPMIRYSYVESLILFFAAHIRDIEEMLPTRYGWGNSGSNVEQELTSRIGGLQLIEALLASVPKDRLYDETSPILLAFLGNGKSPDELIKKLKEMAESSIFDNCETVDASTTELFRKCQCASFNALCAIICNTEIGLKMFEDLLPKENSTTSVWSKIVDQTNNDLYASAFTQEYQVFPKIKQRIVSIRGVVNPEQDTVQKRYTKTESVFASSVSPFITKLDLISSLIRTEAEVPALETTPSTLVVKLEKSPITDHESMAVLCGVYTCMFEQKITPISEVVARTTPEWVARLAQSIGDSNGNKNIRLFLVKSVEICRHIFHHYSHCMTRPVLQLLVDECAGNQMSSFVIDLIVMLLEWKSDYDVSKMEELKELVSQLLLFLMKNAWNARKDVFKRNLEIIKIVVESWRDIIDLNQQLLFESITKTDSRKNICGLQINAIVLANNLTPWTDITQDAYLQSLIKCLNSEFTAVSQPAAQIIGMSLAIIQPDTENPRLRELNKLLTELIANQKVKEFINILYGVYKSYPQIVNTFFMTVAIGSGTSKRYWLEMFLSRMDCFKESEICNVIQSMGLKKLMKCKEYQLLTLHILNSALPKMVPGDIATFMDEICEFVDSSVVECRDIMYEMLMYIRGHFPEPELFQRSSSILLNGLIDPCPDIQRRIFNFWSDPAQLSNMFQFRFLHLFKELFDKESEKHFLSYCTQLILEPAILHQDSKQQMFQHQSDNEATLIEYDIDVSWKTKNNLIKTPLFVSTNEANDFSDDLISTEHNIRQTKTTLAFEPTRDPVTMSQTSDTFSLQSASSFLFSQQPVTLDRRSHKVSSAVQTSGHNSGKVYANLRRRIVSDKDKTSRSNDPTDIQRISYSFPVQSESKQKKEQQVQLYRRYRYGVYPDPLVNRLAMLLPLKGLVKHDKILARQLLIAIFDGGVKELRTTGTTSDGFIKQLGKSAENILRNMKNSEPMVFATIMEIALRNPLKFDLPLDVVTKISMANNMTPVGILYVENRLDFNSKSSKPKKAKSSNSSVNDEQDSWLKLSKMYRNLQEHDIVAGIFSDKLKLLDDKIPRAIELEQNNEFFAAKEIYLEVIERNNELERDFSYDSYYKCLEYLSDWSALSTDLEKQYDSFDELLGNEWKFENVLPLVIKSESRLFLNGVAILNQEVLDELSQSLYKADHIKINFGEELMMLYIAQSNYLSARLHSEQIMTAFISDWCTLNSMSHKIRYNKLLNVRNVAEIHQYLLNILMNAERNANEIDTFCQLWKHSHPQPFDSIILWDAMTTYRTLVGKKMMDSNINKAVEQNISSSTTDIMFKLLDLSLCQTNLELSDVVFAKLSQYEHDDSLSLDLARCRQHLLKANRSTASQDKLKLYCNAWIELDENVMDNALTRQHTEKHINALQCAGEISTRIGRLIASENISSDDLKKLLIGHSMRSSLDNKTDRLYENSYKCLMECVDIAAANYTHIKNDHSAKLVGDAHFKLAEYVQTHCDEGSLHFINDADETMIKALLQSMTYGSKEARQYFPRLLQIKALANDKTKKLLNDEVGSEISALSKLFNDESSQVPAWMFLGWIPQIISELKFDRSCVVDELLLRLAKAYPTAITYPFKLSHSQYKNSCLEVVKDRPMITRINDIIQNPLIDSFVRGLSAVCHPFQKLYSHLASLYLEFRLLTENQFSQKVTNILESVFPTDRSYHGTEYDKLEEFRGSVSELYKLSVIKPKITAKELWDLMSKVNSNKSYKTEAVLAKYSPYLAKFQWCGEENHLELPGQYTGENCPIPSEHIKIIRFDRKITIYKSLRMPIKINIYCSNGKKYPYLVKYGEDMRQDERVQQIFHHMSGILRADEKCRNHQLSIKGYRVVPISTCCGILSFVENTISVSDSITNVIKRTGGNANIFNECIEEFIEFMKVHSKDEPEQTNTHFYGRSVANYDTVQIIENLRSVKRKFTDNHKIKDFLFELSDSPESFFVLRTNFITSLATMNIAHWVLGIGDRHLSNILINQKDAVMLGVDFNLTFGAGTRNAEIPELVPFRLSSQFVDVMAPFGTSGLITKTMVHTLRTFRSQRKLLTSYMESFVKEPTIDWLCTARSRKPDVSPSDKDWDPAMRIKVAERKLTGANPKDLFVEDVRGGQVSKFRDYMAGYVKLLEGDPQRNIRASLPAIGLTVEQQVQCLIDMSTDDALLGIMYHGFQPWI